MLSGGFFGFGFSLAPGTVGVGIVLLGCCIVVSAKRLIIGTSTPSPSGRYGAISGCRNDSQTADRPNQFAF